MPPHGQGTQLTSSCSPSALLRRGIIGVCAALIIGFFSASVRAADLVVTSFAAFAGQTSIQLQATGNVIFAGGAMTLPPLAPGATGQLVIQAGADVIFQTGTTVTCGTGWSVSLQAGSDLGSPGTVSPGVGNLLLQGTASLAAADGSISILAGNNVTVGGGSVRTLAGGAISVTALAGTVNTGTRNNGFLFRTTGTGYSVDSNLGGISTGAGGNVNITAGLDIISYLPLSGASLSDAGSGAFGPQAGNVTVTAGRNVSGHYVVMNGTGTLHAVGDAGEPTALLALSMANGQWSVTAGGNITIQEVRNPNGVFNAAGTGSAPTRHSFDYSPTASAQLMAAGAITLTGNGPRNSGSFEQSIPTIYPPTLSLTAGAGGITLNTSHFLFPSPAGQLTAQTSGGGPLTSASSGVVLCLSDSGATRYSAAGTFGPADHATTPVHLADGSPAQFNISGNVQNLAIFLAKPATLAVGADFVNSAFEVQNLRPNDLTALQVAGNIQYPNAFVSTGSASPPDFALLLNLFPAGTGFPLAGTLNLFYQDPSAGLTQVPASLLQPFMYDAPTETLSYVGHMSSASLSELLSLQVEVLQPNGWPQLDNSGNPITTPAQFAAPAGLQLLYNESQGAQAFPSQGMVIDGPGMLQVTAANFDLGFSSGIQSVGAMNNPALAPSSSTGAAILVNTTGDLLLPTSTICSLAGGPITVAIGGQATLGAANAVLAGLVQNAKHGIFTSAQADIAIEAGGDIRLGASRVAAYDGGNVLIRSLGGSVDISAPGTDSLLVTEEAGNPPATQSFQVAGDGILVTTFPTSPGPVGNITVVAADNVLLGCGAVTQTPFNGTSGQSATVNIHTGGHVVGLGNCVSITATGTLTIDGGSSRPPATPVSLSALLSAGGNSLIVTFEDSSGRQLINADAANYEIQTSTNLVDWTPVSLPLQADGNGGLQFELALDPSSPKVFCRVMSR